MSQQPPYGEPQQPGQQPGHQPYTPYSPGAYPNPYQQGPQRPDHTTRNVLLIVGAVIILVCGGAVGLGVLAFNGIRDSVDDAFDDDYRGSDSDPLVVEEGEAFEIRDYSYAEGWTFVAGGDAGYVNRISGLTVTDNRDDSDYSGPYLTFTFYDGDQALGQIDCRTDVNLRRGKSTTLECNGSDPVPRSYETLEVYDNATFE